jgi:hypothetical protein
MVGKIGLATANLFEWTLTFRIPRPLMESEPESSQALQHEYEVASISMAEESKSGLTRHVALSRQPGTSRFLFRNQYQTYAGMFYRGSTCHTRFKSPKSFVTDSHVVPVELVWIILAQTPYIELEAPSDPWATFHCAVPGPRGPITNNPLYRLRRFPSSLRGISYATSLTHDACIAVYAAVGGLDTLLT